MPRPEPLPNLTSIRLFAALYVFFYHFVAFPGFHLGSTGVNLFFVLSGFILGYNYPAVPDRRRFYALRLARIYPAYALALLITVPQFLHVTWPVSHARVLLGIPAAFALLQTWWPLHRDIILSTAWTLPIEAFFYLTFPFLLPWVQRSLRQWKLWNVLLAILLMVPPAIVFLLLAPAFPAETWNLRNLLYLPLFHLPEFAMGVFCGAHFLSKPARFSGLHVLAALLLCVVATAFAARIPPSHLEYVYNGILALPYAILLYALAGWRSNWFSHPLLQLGGEISYSIYLLQVPANFYLSAIGRAVHHPRPWPLLFIVTIAFSYLSYTFVEKPGRRWMLRKLGYASHPKPIETPGLAV
jgi:peptidoglycan/LPS O-acetylase OafA/YrhL